MNIKVIAIIVLLCVISAEAGGNPASLPSHKPGQVSDNVSDPANSEESKANSAKPHQFSGAASRAKHAVRAHLHALRP